MLGTSRIVLAVMPALPFVLLASAHLARWREGGGELSFVLLLLCILSVYASFVVGALALGAGLLLWLLGWIDPGRGRLLWVAALAIANAASSILWMRLFVRHLNFRY